MGILRRLQHIAWGIGRPFCEFNGRELARKIDVLTAHTEECNQKHERLEGELKDLIRRLDLVNADRLELLKLLTEDEGDPWLRREQSG